MFKGIKFGAVAALVIALTACSGGGVDEQPNNEQAGVANVEETTNTTPEPLVAETPATTESPDAGSPEEQFAERVKFYLDIDPASNQVPNATAEQLIAAGHDACEQIASGTAYEDVRVVEGEQPQNGGYYLDTSAIMSGAIIAYCPVD